MIKGYINHFTTVVLLHGVLILGSWQFVKNEIPTAAQVESDIMRLKVSAGMFTIGSSAKTVVKANSQSLPIPQKKSKTLTKTFTTTSNTSQSGVAVTENVSAASSGSSLSSSDGIPGDTDFSIGSANGTRRATAAELYKAELRAKIDHNKYYPTLSRRLGQTGTVVIAFTLLEDGNIVNVRIDKPSQYERLNISALDAVKKVERFKPIPKEIGEEKMDIKVPVKFMTI